MSKPYTGHYIRIGDICVVEETESVFADNMLIAKMAQPAPWVATFEGPVLMSNLDDGFSATIVRRGDTPQEAVDSIQTLVETFGWRVLKN